MGEILTIHHSTTSTVMLNLFQHLSTDHSAAHLSSLPEQLLHSIQHVGFGDDLTVFLGACLHFHPATFEAA